MSDTTSPGHPMEPEERDALAGEYVLGTLTGSRRQTFEARLRGDADLQRAVADWTVRLQPLADSVAPVAPDPALRRRVVAALAENAVPLRPADAKRWLAWTFGLSALGAIAAALIVMLLWPKAPDIGGYAMLRDKGGKSVLAFQVDHAHRELIVKASMPEAGAGRDYELWIVPEGGKPMSLGVVPASARDERAIPADARSLVIQDVTLAVSLEPAGGSKTGAPTGPVLYTGTLDLTDTGN